MNKVAKKIFNVVIDIVVIIILLISVIIVFLSITSKSAGVPNIFGIAPLSVQSDSMEDTLNVDDLFFAKVTNDSSYKYQVGDIVSFKIPDIDGDGASDINTHRIVEVIEENGIVFYKTQGDNKKKIADADQELQTSATILAKFEENGFKIPKIGAFLRFIRTQLGFFLCILLPMIIFFVYEAIRVIMNIIAYNKEKALEAAAEKVANSELTEEQKQRAIAEYLAQQKAQTEKPKQDSDGEVQTPASAAAQNPETPGTD